MFQVQQATARWCGPRGFTVQGTAIDRVPVSFYINHYLYKQNDRGLLYTHGKTIHFIYNILSTNI